MAAKPEQPSSGTEEEIIEETNKTAFVDKDDLVGYDEEFVQPYMNDYTSKRVSGTVSGSSLVFTDAKITDACVIDGPYVKDAIFNYTGVTYASGSVTYTMEDESANGKSAYIWVRTLEEVSDETGGGAGNPIAAETE